MSLRKVLCPYQMPFSQKEERVCAWACSDGAIHLRILKRSRIQIFRVSQLRSLATYRNLLVRPKTAVEIVRGFAIVASCSTMYDMTDAEWSEFYGRDGKRVS